jgi:RNA polymerase-binding transcription factor DksA
LSADFEDQATDLENQEALEAIENSKIHEIRQIQAALKRVSEGTYGICAHCREDIDPKRLEVLPTATSPHSPDNALSFGAARAIQI